MNEWIAFRGGSPHVLRYWSNADGAGGATQLTDDSGTILTDDSGTILTE